MAKDDEKSEIQNGWPPITAMSWLSEHGGWHLPQSQTRLNVAHYATKNSDTRGCIYSAKSDYLRNVAQKTVYSIPKWQITWLMAMYLFRIASTVGSIAQEWRIKRDSMRAPWRKMLAGVLSFGWRLEWLHIPKHSVYRLKKLHAMASSTRCQYSISRFVADLHDAMCDDHDRHLASKCECLLVTCIVHNHRTMKHITWYITLTAETSGEQESSALRDRQHDDA